MTKEKKETQEAENQIDTSCNEEVCDTPDTHEECPETDNMADECDDATDKASELAVEVAQWKDKFIRLQAEFDNYRKRTLKEKMELIESGGKDLMKSLLVVLDDFDRAQEALASSDNIEALREGVELIHTKMCKVLTDKGLSPIESTGQDFNTDYHEAITKIPAPSDELKGKVVDTVEKGYMLKDKVIRYSKVVVGE
ncbi:MAG: nucleotide exchange factor GrpE [Rikenellaceae bacterium]|nr:nucleotide exchange factor GrpE [Rikenellaceae bacterium]